MFRYQFHFEDEQFSPNSPPQIYKSTRCKDMQQSLFCPRGPFCAFAHDDDEAQIVHDISSVTYPDPSSPSNSVSILLVYF